MSDQYLVCLPPLCCVGRKPVFFFELQQPRGGRLPGASDTTQHLAQEKLCWADVYYVLPRCVVSEGSLR